MNTLAEVRGRLEADPELKRRARGWTARLRLAGAGAGLDIALADGMVSDVQTLDDARATDLCLTAAPEFWAGLWAQAGAAVRTFSGSVLTGELVVQPPLSEPETFRYVGALVRILELVGEPPVAPTAAVDDTGDSEVRGRYVSMTVDGATYRVFVQEAGNGPAVLLLHPGGADSRIWRHVLADRKLQRRFRLTAPDLPFHGRSNPPLDGPPWWRAAYRVTPELGTAWVSGIIAALGLERPALLGLGLGGQLAIQLCGAQLPELAAAVAVNAWLGNGRQPEAFASDALFHPRVFRHAGGAWMAGFSPMSVATGRRREAEWLLGSAGPSVLQGDTIMFESGFDVVAAVRTAAAVSAPLRLLTTEHHCAVPLGAECAAMQYEMLPGFGYLAPLEDPARFNAAVADLFADHTSSGDTG